MILSQPNYSLMLSPPKFGAWVRLKGVSELLSPEDVAEAASMIHGSDDEATVFNRMAGFLNKETLNAKERRIIKTAIHYARESKVRTTEQETREDLHHLFEIPIKDEAMVALKFIKLNSPPIHTQASVERKCIEWDIVDGYPRSRISFKDSTVQPNSLGITGNDICDIAMRQVIEDIRQGEPSTLVKSHGEFGVLTREHTKAPSSNYRHYLPINHAVYRYPNGDVYEINPFSISRKLQTDVTPELPSYDLSSYLND